MLDPTCGSGTTAYVAEQWGRRWMTIDTSRVALALARARIMGARYSYYLLADSKDGQLKEAETFPPPTAQYTHIRQSATGLRLRTGAPHHPPGHSKQHRDRHHLRKFPGKTGAPTRGTQQSSQNVVGRVGYSQRSRQVLAQESEDFPPTMVGPPHRSAERDRCRHRSQSRL